MPAFSYTIIIKQLCIKNIDGNGISKINQQMVRQFSGFE